MATNLKIDEALLDEALKLGKLRTKRATVETALKEFVDKRRQMEIFKLVGKVDFDPDYDYKAQRNRK